MKTMICVFVLLCSMAFSKNYLTGRIPEGDKRYATFQTCLSLLQERDAKVLVETGTDRAGIGGCLGDGCSTPIFGEWAKDHHARFFSVDIDPNAIAMAKYTTSQINPHIQFRNQDSLAFFRLFHQPIDFLYLDSFDFDFNNPDPSQEHHLAEIELAFPFLHNQSVVMIDDCDLPYGGKGKLVIEFLKAHGWKEYMSQYQVIMVKE